MANTTRTRVMIDGPRAVVLQVTMTADGSSGEYSDNAIASASAYNCDGLELEEIWWSCKGCTAILEWDQGTDIPVLAISGSDHFDFRSIGGLTDSGATAILLATTTGFTTADDQIALVMRFKKQFD